MSLEVPQVVPRFPLSPSSILKKLFYLPEEVSLGSSGPPSQLGSISATLSFLPALHLLPTDTPPTDHMTPCGFF